MVIKQPEGAEFVALRGLWQGVFGDNSAYIKLVFTKILSPERTLAAFNGTRPVGMVFFPQYDLKLDKRMQKAGYIFGAAVLPEYRRRGIMARLLQQAQAHMRRDGDKYAFLIPATAALFGYYEKFGYRPFFRTRRFELNTDGFVPCADFDLLYGLYTVSRATARCAVVQDRARFETSLTEFLMEGQALTDGQTAVLIQNETAITVWGGLEKQARAGDYNGMLFCLNDQSFPGETDAFLDLMLD